LLPKRPRLRSWLQDLHTIAKRIDRIEPCESGQRIVVGHVESRLDYSAAHRIDAFDRIGDVRLSSRHEIGFDSEVNLKIPTPEPHPASPAKAVGFLDLAESKHLAVEPSGPLLPTNRYGDLDMMN
jgi:hypothetical protein